jgi:hypothetical protein
LKIFESLVENLQKEEVLFNICLLFFVLKKKRASGNAADAALLDEVRDCRIHIRPPIVLL